LAVVGIVALCIYSGQLKVMQGTLTEMKRSGGSATWQMWEAIGNINWLAKTMDASQKQAQMALEASIEQSNLDRRAWISPQTAGITGEFLAGHMMTVGVQYANVGREPALDVRPVYKFKRVAASAFSNNTINPIIEKDNICKGIRIAPGADVVYPQQPNGYKLTFRLPATFVTDDLVSGDDALIFEMCFAYTSGRKIHHTSFCYFHITGISPTDQMNICTAGNHTD
jgi:hypothetical protein